MAESGPDDVSIVVPAWREERRIGRAVRELRALAGSWPGLREIIVVVEPGNDGTARVALEAAQGDPTVCVVENTEHRGKGSAVRTGMRRAAGGIIFSWMRTSVSLWPTWRPSSRILSRIRRPRR